MNKEDVNGLRAVAGLLAIIVLFLTACLGLSIGAAWLSRALGVG